MLWKPFPLQASEKSETSQIEVVRWSWIDDLLSLKLEDLFTREFMSLPSDLVPLELACCVSAPLLVNSFVDEVWNLGKKDTDSVHIDYVKYF